MISWSYFFPPPEPERTVEQPTPEIEAAEQPVPRAASPPPEVVTESSTLATTTEVSQTPPPAVPVELETVVGVAEERVVVTGDIYRAEFTSRGAQLVSFQLLEHRNSDGGPVDLVRARARDPHLFGFATLDGASSALNDVLFRVQRESGDFGRETVVFLYQGAEGRVEKRFAFQPNGLLGVEIDAATELPWAVVLGPGVRNPSSAEMDNRFARRSAVYRHAEGVERVDPARMKAPEGLSAIGLQWVGLDDSYFLTAVVPQEGLEAVVVQPVVVIPGGDEGTTMFRPFRDLEELGEVEQDMGRELYLFLQPQGNQLRMMAYLGAKEFERLAALPYGLEETIRLGWFKFLSLPLLWGLLWIHDNVVANYGWAIILMTILIRLILFPLTHKSTVSMQKMQEINPKVQAIRQKYRSKLKDKQGRPNPEMQRKMNEETMALYKTEGVNPAGGCLPMLLQIPVLFAFYNILSASIEIRHAPWILWIADLSAKDPLYVLPIVMGATQFLQQKMTPAAGDPMQRRMFALMPIFFTILFLGFPSGLVLYWLTNNVLGIGQQYLYKRMREAKAEAAKQSTGGSRGKGGKKKE
jgi:YidC/Oxa1 family membrane protein insertase